MNTSPKTNRPGCPLDQVAESISAICQRTFQQPDAKGRVDRTFHKRTHALLRAKLTIHDSLPKEVSHGLFSAPHEFDSWVRFSSAMFHHDRAVDLQGMAVKILNTEGLKCESKELAEHDLFLANQSEVNIRNGPDALEYCQKIDGVKNMRMHNFIPLTFLIPNMDPRKVRWRIFGLVMDSLKQRLFGFDLSRMSFYSATPYRLSEGAMKYMFLPVQGNDGRVSGTLTNRLQQRLATGPIRYSFRIQRRTHPEQEPIDDAMASWRSPFEEVGQLEIPPQDFETKERQELDQHIAFSPWNCLECHEPLGSLNQVRRIAYRDAANNRRSALSQ